MNWLKKIFGTSREESAELREVPGAMAVRTSDKKVAYNMLTPHMQQFMGRCVSAIKRIGLRAKGTGQFSILVGAEEKEIRLEEFYQPSDDPALVDRVLEEARKISGVS